MQPNVVDIQYFKLWIPGTKINQNDLKFSRKTCIIWSSFFYLVHTWKLATTAYRTFIIKITVVLNCIKIFHIHGYHIRTWCQNKRVMTASIRFKAFFAIRSLQSETHCMMLIYEWGPFSHYYLKPRFSFIDGQNIRIMIVLNFT